ncbi:hypothetical protein BJ138DRAFT_1120098 [Hygrophoropsis aurantiaca]|uniref:Uncharacterized protein n=1 Tax=Hygrophoropsis aurantiaca TaxID=72124 RepID=A0ACB7ZRM6_9AGAM|nr:hypothetical protein BJ138DRAFT_1120098 [Hygrophoropsis aurantiaca]
MSTAIEVEWIRKRILCKVPKFPDLITAVIFGAQCDAGLIVQVPIRRGSRSANSSAKILSQLYLCPTRLPQGAGDEVDSDDSYLNEPAVTIPWKLTKRQDGCSAYVSSVVLDSVVGVNGEKAMNLENPFTFYYVNQAHAAVTYPRNDLVEDIARIHYPNPPQNYNLHGGVLVVKHARGNLRKVVHMTQEDTSVVRVAAASALYEGKLQ